MALESTQLFHRQSNVSQRLCLTVDSSPLTDNVLRSNQATVSPTFSIADILASSFPESATECRLHNSNQSPEGTAALSPSADKGESAVHGSSSGISTPVPEEEVTKPPQQTTPLINEETEQKCDHWLGDIKQPIAAAAAAAARSSHLHNTFTSFDTVHSEGHVYDRVEPSMDVGSEFTELKPNDVPTKHPTSPLNSKRQNLSDGSLCSPTNRASKRFSCCLTRSPVFHIDVVTDRQQVSTGTDTDLVDEEKTANPLTMDDELLPSPLHDKVDDLLDAARCVRAEAQLEEAESVVDALVAKFAEPLDLYTAWENLHRPGPTPIPPLSCEQETGHSSEKAPKIPSFSPILPWLLSLPESNIFPQLCQPSSTGRKLLELCKQLAGDIRRTKRKLRILHKARARRSSNSGSARANTSTHKPPTCPTNAATVNDRRTSYLRRLHEIWPEHDESTGSSLDPCPSPSVVTKRPSTVPCVYTSPMECPLSLLSFVSDSMHTIHSQLVSPNRTPDSTTVLSKPATAVASPSTTTESKSLHTADKVGNCARELTVQVHSVGPEQRSPATLSCCPSLSDTHPSFPGVESPSLPTFSLLSPSLSPSSSSTISAGGIGVMGSLLSYSGSRATGTKSKTVPRNKKPKAKDLLSCSSSSSSSRSSSGHQKRPRRADRQTSGKKQSTQQASRRRDRNTSLRSPTSTRTTAGNASRAVDSDTDSRRRDRAPKLQLPRPISSRLSRTPNAWEQLRVVVRNSDETETAPDLTSPVTPDRPALTAPCSAPCVSFFQSESLNAAEHSVTPTKRTLSQQQQQQPGEFSDTGLIASSCGDIEWPNQDDRSSHGIPNRPPTPDIRRSDLDLADLSNGTRVLVIQDTHLRAGTLYVGPSGSTTSPDPITLPTSSLRDHLFRIQLDAERTMHPSSPRFTSLPSPSRMTAAPSRRTSSPARATNTGLGSLSTSGTSGTAGTPKKRRQSDLVLYGWQVVQQAVLEVFPASVRHVPPGTRVCAAWSEQLAADLYPGTVTQAEPKEQIQPNCVPVGFDDGDRRQVPIPNIRILPDHFTNLYELASATHNQGGLGPSDLLPSATGLSMEVDQSLNAVKLTRTAGRVRHHSAMDRPSALVASGLTELVRSKRMGRTTQRVHTASAAVQLNKKPEPPDSSLNQTKKDSVTGKNECTAPSSKCLMGSSVSSKTEQSSFSEPLSSPTTSANSQKRRHSSTADPGLSTPDEERVKDDFRETSTATERAHIHASRPTTDSSLIASSESGVEVNPDGQNSPLLDNEVLSDTLSTISSESEQQQQPVWHILDKVRRRKHRGISCRSIVRQTDGLIISVGDSVEFSSGHDEVYLGEVRAIRWEEVMNAPVVIAAWYYNLNEAGSDGELIKQLKGAVFATEHHDENEARCIVRRVQVAPSYAAYQAMMQASDREPIQMDTVPKRTIKPDPESNQQTPINPQTNRVELPDAGQLSTKPSSLFQDSASQEQTTISENNHGDNRGSSTPSSSGDESEEDVYFVAGKYDPVHRRVVAWDPDIARIIKSS